MFSELWTWVGTTNPDVWAAAAGWATFLIALIASIAAFRQVREARTLRQEQAQPYVVAYMELSAASQQLIDIVVKNFGLTAAHDVVIRSTPDLKRSSSESADGELVRLFDLLPVLVPGQEWRVFWDNSLTRKDTALPDRYEVEVHFKDSHGKQMSPYRSILDWSVYKGRMWVETFGLHAAAKALHEMNQSMKKWSEFGGGLAVTARDGDAKDVRRASDSAASQARLEEMRNRLLPANQDGDGSGIDPADASC